MMRLGRVISGRRWRCCGTRLAEQLDLTEAQIHAQLAAQYRATLAELAAMPADEKGGARERLAKRVAAADVAS